MVVRGRSSSSFSSSGRTWGSSSDKPLNFRPTASAHANEGTDDQWRMCKNHVQHYQECVQRYGKDNFFTSSARGTVTAFCGADIDPDTLRVPSRPVHEIKRECEGYFKLYEESVLEDVTGSYYTKKVLYIANMCAATVDPGMPSTIPRENRYRPTPSQCNLHLKKFEEVSRHGDQKSYIDQYYLVKS